MIGRNSDGMTKRKGREERGGYQESPSAPVNKKVHSCHDRNFQNPPFMKRSENTQKQTAASTAGAAAEFRDFRLE